MRWLICMLMGHCWFHVANTVERFWTPDGDLMQARVGHTSCTRCYTSEEHYTEHTVLWDCEGGSWHGVPRPVLAAVEYEQQEAF